jgi:hypothetical protein
VVAAAPANSIAAATTLIPSDDLVIVHFFENYWLCIPNY